jgi:uncharacterized heparinase superfamily protein
VKIWVAPTAGLISQSDRLLGIEVTYLYWVAEFTKKRVLAWIRCAVVVLAANGWAAFVAYRLTEGYILMKNLGFPE